MAGRSSPDHPGSRAYPLATAVRANPCKKAAIANGTQLEAVIDSYTRKVAAFYSSRSHSSDLAGSSSIFHPYCGRLVRGRSPHPSLD